MTATRGQAAPEVEATYRRALALCEQGGQTPYFFSAQLGLWAFYQLRAQYKISRPLAERLLGMALDTQKPEQLAEGHRALGSTSFRLGQMGVARTHMEQVLALQRPDYPVYDFLLGYGRDPAAHAMSTVGWILWYLGLPDLARTRCQEALVLARNRPDASNLALCLIFAAEVHQCRREVQLTREYAEAAIAISCEHGFPLFLAWGTVLQGWVLADQGSHEAGIAQIRQGLADYAATGAALGRPNFLALLAESYEKAGDAHAGLEVLNEALASVEETGERVDEATLHRLKGELILLQPSVGPRAFTCDEEAEACFHKAIAVARDQGLRSLELKAALSLARLWQRQGKRDAARQTLATIHGTFTEGFDCADWQQAKALLDDLA
ncbi:guanylate cyclase [Pandoraea terrae]|uniref:Guanylate cyclase n=1 Tax=Pandoraea terrae TaxID=1537710 RepID=A0A5E4TLW0_9BURK|nr:guanylate cyclase [Pandoraea terrae]